MNVMDLLKSVGTGLVSAHPMGAAAITLINGFLPADKKLVGNVTGEQATQAVDTLPADARLQITMANIDLAKEQERGMTARYEAMCAADGQQTRAKIVLIAMWAMVVITGVLILATVIVYIKHGADAAFSGEMVAFYFAVTGTFAYVIKSYFGDLRKETESRHAIVDEKPRMAKGVAGVLQALRSGK